MHHLNACFLSVATVTSVLFVFVSNVSDTDLPRNYHRIEVVGVRHDKAFIAKIEGHEFSTLSSLEDYLVTLPAGSWVRYEGSLTLLDTYTDTEERVEQLRVFCSEHQINFKTRIDID